MTRTLVARALLSVVLGALMVVVGGQAASATAGPAAASEVATRTLGAAVIPTDCRSTYLHYGSRGTCVVRLQVALNLFFDAGLAVDGIYGKATTNAVYHVQARYDLAYDGRCGPQTWGRLAWVEYRFFHGQSY